MRKYISVADVQLLMKEITDHSYVTAGTVSLNVLEA